VNSGAWRVGSPAVLGRLGSGGLVAVLVVQCVCGGRGLRGITDKGVGRAKSEWKCLGVDGVSLGVRYVVPDVCVLIRGSTLEAREGRVLERGRGVRYESGLTSEKPHRRRRARG